MPEDEARRELPRFEVVLVVVGGKQRFFAIDHLTKRTMAPVNPYSREQAENLRDLWAANARDKEEQLTVRRLVSALEPPPKPKRATKAGTRTDRHAPQSRSH